MREVITLILGGGRGTRLYPLTRYRSKPAVPLAGKYRLIDIPISNCINSGLNHIYLLTQFMSVSLHRHIRLSYQFDRFSGGFVEILAAQQTLDDMNWYQGTADAVRKNIRYLQQPGIEHVLILSGDQLYRMDYREMLKTHRESGAEATIAGMPVSREAASALGIMRLDDSGRVVGFLEKPQTQEECETVRMDPAWIDAAGIPSRGRDLVASMGLYVFNRDFLLDVLTKTDYRDFGREIFPASLRARQVQVHLFDGYWEDIGTIASFYQCNLALAGPNPPFDFISAEAPIYSHARHLAPSRLEGATIRGSLIADGCVIGDGAVIENSVIGLRCQIGKDVVIRNSVLMGADLYESEAEMATNCGNGRPPLGIGSGTRIEGAIVDKNCRIGRNVVIANPNQVVEADWADEIAIRDKIVCVQKETALADGWKN